MKVLFVEPPKDIWFVMGEYLPPPYGIIQLAAYLEREVEDVEILLAMVLWLQVVNSWPDIRSRHRPKRSRRYVVGDRRSERYSFKWKMSWALYQRSLVLPGQE